MSLVLVNSVATPGASRCHVGIPRILYMTPSSRRVVRLVTQLLMTSTVLSRKDSEDMI